MASMQIDASELKQLGADLSAAGSGIAARVRPVVVRGAVNIKNQMRREMSGSASFGALAGSIDFSMTSQKIFGTGVIEAEIGPSKRRGGARRGLGFGANIAYFGTSRGGGTVPDPQGALDAEAPRFEQALGDIMEGLL